MVKFFFFFLSFSLSLLARGSECKKRLAILMPLADSGSKLSATASGWRQERRWIFQTVVPFSPTAVFNSPLLSCLRDARKEINSGFFLPSSLPPSLSSLRVCVLCLCQSRCRCCWQQAQNLISFHWQQNRLSLFFSIYKKWQVQLMGLCSNSRELSWAELHTNSRRRKRSYSYSERTSKGCAATALWDETRPPRLKRIFNNHQRAVQCHAVSLPTISLHNT